MVAVHTREQVGLRAPNLQKLALRTKEQTDDKLGLTVHHTGYGGTLYHLDPIVRLKGIQDYHMNTLGYGDIAYEGAFDADANVYILRDGRYVGAHAYGTKRGANVPNQYTDGIVYLEDARGWTRGGADGLNWWMNLYKMIYKKNCHLFAHCWWSLTSCPESYLIDVVKFTGGSF